MRKSDKKVSSKYLVLGIIFIVTMVLTFLSMSFESVTPSATTMSAATIPVITMQSEEGNEFNSLHGFTQEINQALINDNLTPVAKTRQLPIIIHSRDAAKDTYDVMKANRADEMGGIVHCFSYTKEMAKKFMDMGFYLGIGGVVTFSNARKLQEVVEYMPMDKMVIETDCPYMSPVPNRGKRNDSFNLPYVVNKIAEIKGISPTEVIDITCENAKNVYGIGRKRI